MIMCVCVCVCYSHCSQLMWMGWKTLSCLINCLRKTLMLRSSSIYLMSQICFKSKRIMRIYVEMSRVVLSFTQISSLATLNSYALCILISHVCHVSDMRVSLQHVAITW